MGVDRLFADSRQEPWSPRRRVKTTWWMIGVMAGLFFTLALIKGLGPDARRSVETLLAEWFSVSPDGLLGGRLWQLFTYQLLHADGMHLVWNMLVLFFVGSMFEDLYGPRPLLRTFAFCGAFAGLACFLEGGPVVGASGSIMALLVVLAIRIPEQQVYLLFFPIRMKWVAVLIIGLDVLQLLGNRAGDVSHFTHLAGASAGVGYAWLWPRMMSGRIQAMGDRRRRRREIAAMEKDLDNERELDRLLDKISREGMDSLSPTERKFLQTQSRRLQDSR